MVGPYCASRGFLATLTLLWLSSLCWTETCPSYQVGEHGSQQRRKGINGNTVYINTIDSAPCAGEVYGWRLCFMSANAGTRLQMSMYREDGDSYPIVNGSVYDLTLQTGIFSYSCLDRFLEESDHFSIEQGDMVAACWSSRSRVNIFSQNDSKQLVSGGSCSQDVINQHSQTDNREILLSAYINVNECLLGEAMCHNNAACSDVVGGENSYNCTCNLGFTGDGFSCIVNGGMEGSENSTSEGDGGGVSGGVVAGVVVVLLLVVGALAVAAGLVGWVLYRRKRLGQQQLTAGTLNSIDNEVYGKHYEMAPDYNATPYEVPQESLRKDGFSSQHFQPDLVYETTAGANIYASPAPPQESSFIYELPGNIYEQTVAAENIYESASPYECPSQDETGLYEQIRSYSINVISRKDIKILSHLGCGQFGSVNKAQWTNGRRQTTVAVKTLTDSANTVKFLQEAAIMAQFRHPNILTLHGVVSAGHPVSIKIVHVNIGNLLRFYV
ncbi:Tyrosine-protein kinase isoform SRK4 [Geodia barretti]|uniref:Tyrosine-protein kinase isoform SRK4 n=1 Tax=Geodia barretti TaxID=519541 RepID=A0AA35S3W9_GEOBA|nr:Tyrosine-protein kinase isoform SRK4 [Geodia barretti]